MPRPRRCRWVSNEPSTRYFKPRGIPMSQLEDMVLTVDEIEAVRLADYEGFYQDEAAKRMNISRQTFGRIVVSARRKIAEAIIFGKAIRIEGGEYVTADQLIQCADCDHIWHVTHNLGTEVRCPVCRNGNIIGTQEK